ncbi:MAG: xanthine dehydrogenase family protein subunit M [Candidatus Rokubacteria bacterium]|nr:xanthine dehydrogenase family protein subunit M [Candidatus Rokubacteria bacterium]
MKPAPFAYVRARSLDEALGCLVADPEAKILAGGQSLVPMMNMRLARPSTLVDLNAVAELSGVDAAADGGLAIGALTRHTDLVTSPLVRERAPLLATAAAHIGHRAIRNRGTLGGSLAHADPAAELPAAVLALGATLVAAGPGGRRRIAADDFFLGLFATALAADEILVAVETPPHRDAAWGFAEVARRAGDFAIAGAAVAAIPGDVGRSARVRLVAFGVDDRPIRLTAAEIHLGDPALTPDAAAAAGAAAAGCCHPAADVHASAEYRRHLVSVLTEQVVREAAGRRAARREGESRWSQSP